MSIEFEKRVQVNKILESQLPEFVVADFPLAVDFLKTYYNSLEYQGSAGDIIENFDRYIKVDNLVPEVITGKTTLTSDISITDVINPTINVDSTKGFPAEYGLLKIDDEIITYTGKTDTTFTGCIRGFSGVTNYKSSIESTIQNVNKETLEFKDTNAADHTTGSTVTNLSVLFLQEFYRKLKKTFLPGLEDNEFASGIDVGNFIKVARSFYQSKGISESVKILFKVLFGKDAEVLDLEERLIKPSGAEYIRREVIIAEKISGNPSNLVGQTITKSTDSQTSGSVSEVEILTRDRKEYYKISLFVGFSDRDLIEGTFTIPGKSKVLEYVTAGSEIISVDSTIGFPTSGDFVVDGNIITYSSKSVNQFFGCAGVDKNIEIASDLRSTETIFGYENGDINKKSELRITGVLSEFVPDGDISLISEGQEIYVKNLGESIKNPVESVNKSFKQVFANSWVYNTSSRYQINGFIDAGDTTFELASEIDKSSLKKGDSFVILRRNTQTEVGGGQITQIDLPNLIQTNRIWLDESLDPNPNAYYDIRRVLNKASAKNTGIGITYGNNKVLSDVLNVYTKDNDYGYVASNSLPSYEIDAESIVNTIPTGEEPFLTSPAKTDPLTNYPIDFLEFTFATEVKFNSGDPVVYRAGTGTTEPTLQTGTGTTIGLQNNGVYYAGVGTDRRKVKLYQSISAIDFGSPIGFNSTPSNGVSHNLYPVSTDNKKIRDHRTLRKFNLYQDLNVSAKEEEPVNDIGLLVNGVQIRSCISDDKINYGPIENIDIFNGGSGYDVVNPPKVVIETPVGVGTNLVSQYNTTVLGAATTALCEPVISGTVKEIIVDEQNFDIDRIISVSLSGGNGTGCLLEPIVGPRFREVQFDSRDIFFSGGLDIQEETITFKGIHNFIDGQLIYYNSNGHDPIGITAFKDPSTTITEYLTNGAPYYVKVLNPSRIRLFKTPDDALHGVAGINTIGFSTATTAAGIHKFRTTSKNTLRSIKVLTAGSDYQYRKLPVQPSGISTSYDTINFKNHGFRDNDLVEYTTMVGMGVDSPTTIEGLDTSLSYRVVKVDENSFKLTHPEDYSRRKYIDLRSSGTGYQVFKYPNISVSIEATSDNNIAVNFTNLVTPIVTGEIIGAYVYEKGSHYGSRVVNHKLKSDIVIQNGRDAEVKAFVENGEIKDVFVLNRGKEYNSLPELEISGPIGSGAQLKPIINNGQLIDVVVINTGIGYSDTSTNVFVNARGHNGLLDARVRELSIDRVNHENTLGNYHLAEDPTTWQYDEENKKRLSDSPDTVTFNISAYSKHLAEHFNDEGVDVAAGTGTHSPIIGWAYDGCPIYGPYGYSDPDDIGEVKRLVSGYVKDIDWFDRPDVPAGFFVNDWRYDANGDLDKHNGRFCKTPEFPNGIYAYFSTLDSDNITPVFPYFIGKTYRLPLIQENISLDQSFDFNTSRLSRNTFPYKVNDRFADNDFLIESNEIIKQKSVVESVTRGVVDSFQVLDGGSKYKVGDFTTFDNTGTNGTGARGIVDEIVGIGVSSIKTDLTKFENSILVWQNENEIQAHFLPSLPLNDEDTVLISGLSTSNYRLNNSFKVGISTNIIGLAKTMNVNNSSAGTVEDIYVNEIPNTVSIGGSIQIGSEILKVLNLYDLEKIIRVRRYGTGIGHTYGSNIDVINNRITIPVKTDYFESKVNQIEYFNPNNSVGLGTTSGSSLDYTYGEISLEVPVPPQTIYVPNHPFTTGQKVKLRKPLAKASFLVGRDDDASNQFYIPNQSSGVSDVYVIDKGTNHIGLATNAGAAKTEAGLYFFGNGSNDYEYTFESDYEQLTANIDRIVSTVITEIGAANTTTHGLQNNDLISLNVVPNVVVGLGSTAPVSVSYNKEHEKLLINTVIFEASDIDTLNNSITINNHGYKTGDKLFYDSDEIASGLTTGGYFVHEIDSNKFNLSETYKDSVSIPPNIVNITSDGGNKHEVSLINPQITVVKNSNLTFGLSTSSLDGFDFKLFYDKEYKNEFINAGVAGETFSVSGVGTVGLGTTGGQIFDFSGNIVGAAVSIGFSTALPSVMYYALEKGGYISTTDTSVLNYSQIKFVDSNYSGDYKVFDVTDETFKISPRSVPEVLTYEKDQCDVIEYSSKSETVVGPIKSVKLISEGFSYKSVPGFTSVTSLRGENANVVALSTSIGKINQIRIIDFGFEYSSDKTLRPEAFIPPVVRIDDLDQIDEVEVVDGGLDYLSSPDLILYNPEIDEVVDRTSLTANVPYQSITGVNVIAPIKGLDSVTHRVVAINNSNGIGIVSMTTNGTVARCVMETPINGYNESPFKEGDEIFVEGIQLFGESGIGTQQSSASGVTVDPSWTGYNSENYKYQFFKVKSYQAINPDILEFDLIGVSTNPGIAKTYQSGYANIINRSKYPTFAPVQKRARFALNETILVKEGLDFVEKDIFVVESREDFIKIDGIDELKMGDRITGSSSGTVATVTGFINNKAKFRVDYSNRQDYGWLDNTGKLSEDFQVIPDNDYYQNLSYSIKSEKTWDDFVDPVNRLIHPAGLKNFSDTIIENKVSAVGIGTTQPVVSSIVLDITSERRVDTINYFDLANDYDVRDDINSKFVNFRNKRLTDYTKCRTNRVIIHDDISGRFSSKGSQDLFTEIEEINTNYAKYLVQIIDPDTFDTQFSDLIVLTSTDNAFILEKTSDFTNIKLGDFSADVDTFNRKTLNFTPTEKFEKDHDLKIIKTSFGSDLVSSGTKEFGCVDLVGKNVDVAVGRTTFTGSISGTTLTSEDFDLTSVSKVGIGTTLTGPGIEDGTEIVSIDSTHTATLSKSNTRPSTNNLGFMDVTIGRRAIPLGVTTTTIAEFSHTDFNAFYANSIIKDKVTGELDYNELIINYDGESTYISEIYGDVLDVSFSSSGLSKVGILTTKVESGTISFDCINDRNSALVVSTNIVGLGTTTAGIGTYRFNVPNQPEGSERTLRYESSYSSGKGSSGSIQPIMVTKPLVIENDSTVKSLVRVSCGTTSAIHQVIVIQDKNDDAVTVQYPHVSVGTDTGIGTFGSNTAGQNLEFLFYPDQEFIDTEELIEVQAYNEVFSTLNDFENEPDILEYGPVSSDLILASYDGPNGSRGNKVNFDLKFEGTPIYFKRFNPSDPNTVSTTVGGGSTLTIPNHFFNDNEEITYKEASTFIGVAPVAIGIAATMDNNGFVQTTMPSTVYVKALDPDKIQLFSRKEYVSADDAIPITFTNSGQGNAHKLEMTNKLSKTVIGLDGIIQQPITYTSINHNLPSTIGIGLSQFSLSGISSVQPRDVLKVNNEYMKVEEVGFGTDLVGTINSVNGTIPLVKVKRGCLGLSEQIHVANSNVQVYRGSFNVVDSTAWFLDAPKGNTRTRRSLTNLPYVKAEYSGRTFLRSNYDTNMIFDDLSDSFTGIGRTYTLTVGGANTSTGVSVGNGILFVNGVFQTPLTLNNLGNNYEIVTDTSAGISSVVFTGISSENGQKIQSEFDINQNQIPRGGLIVSLGSTVGRGYAPLVGARVHPKLVNGTIGSIVGVGTSVGPVGGGIQTAHYDHRSGIMTVTTNTGHGFALGTPEAVKVENMWMDCEVQHAGITTNVFQDTDRPLQLVGVASERTFEVFAGICTIPHNYFKNGEVWAYYDELTFGSGYRNPVSIGVNDINYLHKFVSSTNNSITAYTGSFMGESFTPTKADYNSVTGDLLLTIDGSHTIPAPVDYKVNYAEYDSIAGIMTVSAGKHYDVSGADYNPQTGDMVLNIGKHSLNTTNKVKIAPNSLTFSCEFGGTAAEKTYPRSSGTGNPAGGADPAYDTFISITAVDTDAGTITVNVLSTTPSTNVDDHTFVSAISGAVFVPHKFTNNEQVKFDDNSITFTCAMDNNGSDHTYPRVTDPSSNKWLVVSSATDTQFETNVGTSPIVAYTPTTGTTYDPNTGLMVLEIGTHTIKSGTSVRLEQESIKFSCGFGGATGTAAQKSYPRSNGNDPYYNTAITVQATTDTTITLQVLTTIPSTNTDPHTFVSATAGAVKSGGFYEHTFKSSTDNGMSGTKSLKIAQGGLTFRCSKDADMSLHPYPRTTDPAYDAYLPITSVSPNTFMTNVGPGGGAGTGAVVTARVAYNDHKFVSSSSPISSSNGGTLTISDAKYDPASGIMTVTTNSNHGFGVMETHTIENAVYNPNVGIVTITTDTQHGFSNGDYVKIEEESLVFNCSKDSYLSEHAYPRKGDPIHNKWVQISNKTDFKFEIQCLTNIPASDTSLHNFIRAKDNQLRKASSHVQFVANTLTFTCNQDSHRTTHDYPRTTDPIHNRPVGIEEIPSNTSFTINVGKSPAGTGGSLEFTIENSGSGYVNPEIIVPQPVYENMPVVGTSRLGVGKTTDTGVNLLLDLKVGAAKTTVGIGSTLFEISEFDIARDGHSFKIGDRLKPIGLVPAVGLQEPLQEFELNVVEVFNDYFSAWQFGEIDFIDDIRLMQNGRRRRFPLFFNGQLLSFETDKNEALSESIDLNAVLLIFVNGVLQTPGIAYQFEGGTTFTFTEPPDSGDKVDVFFYLGQRGVDVELVDIQETIRPGDQVRLHGHPSLGEETFPQDKDRVVKEILTSNLVETNIYSGPGIDEFNDRPLEWIKQKTDLSIQGSLVVKSRESIEPQIYPTAKIIADVETNTGTQQNGGIFVDDAEAFFYEEGPIRLDPQDRYSVNIAAVDALMLPGSTKSDGTEVKRPAGATATIELNSLASIGNTSQYKLDSISVTDGGFGYTVAPTVKLPDPDGLFTGGANNVWSGTGVTATATANIVDGSVISIDITNPGFGYSGISSHHASWPIQPQVLIESPQYESEKITSISNVQGFSGIITGISTTTGTNNHPLAIKFFFQAIGNYSVSDLLVGYPVMIKDTKIGDGIVSVDSHDTSIVGIGTSFADNIYKVHDIASSGRTGEITCNILSTTNHVGLASTGGFDQTNIGITTSLGRLSWGRLYNATRDSNPISIGVTGFTVDVGLSSFPTIQRKNYTDSSLKGLRNTGAIRLQVL
tara:strand:+ start:2787 stop:17753 length:14967 start_codon:yes stop_codon:yes gene_type:complete